MDQASQEFFDWELHERSSNKRPIRMQGGRRRQRGAPRCDCVGVKTRVDLARLSRQVRVGRSRGLACDIGDKGYEK